jgi:hypothetical protein
MYVMRKLLLFFFCCGSFSALSQDLTGIWRGHFRSSGSSRILEQLLGEEDRYKFEIQLDQTNKQFQGVTYSYKTTVFYGKATCRGAVNTKTKKVLLEELKIVELRMVGGEACIMTLFLQYSKSGDEEFLEGSYTSMNVRDSTNCGRGTLFLRKVTTSDFHKEPFLVNREKEKAAKKPPVIAKTTKPATTTPNNNPAKKPVTPPKTSKSTTTTKPTKPVESPTPSKTSTAKKTTTPNPSTTQPKTNPSTTNKTTVKIVPVDSVKKAEKKPVVVPRVLLTRENELVKTIETNSNEITINLYDNGTIDNDTVSVYLDKKLVVTKQRLTEKPISLKVQMDENNMYHELVMVAENLGEIPPNTSLMVVKAGNKHYEVRITSTEQKNAVVIFKYQKTQ